MKPFLLAMTLSLFSGQIYALDSCTQSKVKIEALVTQYDKVNGKVKKRYLKIPIEPEWSIHSGRYDQFIVQASPSPTGLNLIHPKLEQFIVLYADKRHGKRSKEKNLGEIIDKFVAQAPGKIKIHVMNRSKPICEMVINLAKSESP